jgi:hypothetical protein
MSTHSDSTDEVRKSDKPWIPSGGWAAFLLVWAIVFGGDTIRDLVDADGGRSTLLWLWTGIKMVLIAWGFYLGARGVWNVFRK